MRRHQDFKRHEASIQSAVDRTAAARLRYEAPHLESADCWCCPTLNYVDPATGVAHYIHHDAQ